MKRATSLVARRLVMPQVRTLVGWGALEDGVLVSKGGEELGEIGNSVLLRQIQNTIAHCGLAYLLLSGLACGRLQILVGLCQGAGLTVVNIGLVVIQSGDENL